MKHTGRHARKPSSMHRIRNLLRVATLSALTLGGPVALSGCVGRSPSNEEINKQVVLHFYDVGLNKRDYAAASPYFGNKYIQHNPTATDGPLGFRGFIENLGREHPHARVEIIRTIAQGDFVALHVHAILDPGDRGLAIVDIYRLENHKIVEHWDVIQPVPEHSANPNGMFGPDVPNAGHDHS